jgi:hypothetical protein
MLCKLITKFRSFFTKIPAESLSWNGNDFKTAKRWALSQPDPMGEMANLWERIYSPRKDSVEIIAEINSIIEEYKK